MSPLSHQSTRQERTCPLRCLSRVTCARPGMPLGRAGAAVAPLERRSAGPARTALACGELAAEPGEAARGYEQQFCFLPLARVRAELQRCQGRALGKRLAAEPRALRGGWLCPTGPGSCSGAALTRGCGRGGCSWLSPFLPRSCHGISTEPELLCQAPVAAGPSGHGRDHPAVPAVGSCSLSTPNVV